MAMLALVHLLVWQVSKLGWLIQLNGTLPVISPALLGCIASMVRRVNGLIVVSHNTHSCSEWTPDFASAMSIVMQHTHACTLPCDVTWLHVLCCDSNFPPLQYITILFASIAFQCAIGAFIYVEQKKVQYNKARIQALRYGRQYAWSTIIILYRVAAWNY